jgi:hypothetical protein
MVKEVPIGNQDHSTGCHREAGDQHGHESGTH